MKLWAAWLSLVLLKAFTRAGVNNVTLPMSPWFREPANRDQISNSNLLKTTPMITMLDCAYMCTATEDCISFFYVRPKKTCRMHTGTFAIGLPLPGIIPEPDTDFYANKCNHAKFQLLAPKRPKYFTATTSHSVSNVAAKELCARTGGTLLTIEDDVEYVNLMDNMKENGWTGAQAFWVDAGRQDSISPYRWSNGKPVNDTHWAANEPNQDIGKTCVLLVPGQGLGNLECEYGAGPQTLYALCQCFL